MVQIASRSELLVRRRRNRFIALLLELLSRILLLGAMDQRLLLKSPLAKNNTSPQRCPVGWARVWRSEKLTPFTPLSPTYLAKWCPLVFRSPWPTTFHSSPLDDFGLWTSDIRLQLHPRLAPPPCNESSTSSMNLTSKWIESLFNLCMPTQKYRYHYHSLSREISTISTIQLRWAAINQKKKIKTSVLLSV